MSEAKERQPFLEHVQELRGRLGWCVAALLAGTAAGYHLKDQLLELLVKPLGKTLYYTSPGGGFSLIVQLCLGFGIVCAVPVVLYQLIKFLSPVLPNYSIRLLAIVLISSCLLVGIGVSFAYFVSLPAALYFLNEFSNEQVQALISTDTYISFVAIYLAGFAILFQLPLVLLLINIIKPLTPKKLLANTKWVILVSFIVAAIITPTPDPFNQTIMAGPVIALYLGSTIPLKIVNRRRDLSPEPPEPASQLDTTSEPAPAATTHQAVLTAIAPVVRSEEHQDTEDDELDLSQLTLSMRQPKNYKQREGELCLWKFKDGHSTDIIVTFLYQGKHEFVKVHHPAAQS